MTVARLLLVRHAKSDYPLGVDDHDRPLNPRGERDAPEIGRWLGASVSLSPSVRVIISSAARAQATWALAQSGVDHGVVETDPRIYEASPATLREVIRERAAHPDILLVGHNPGLAMLIAELGAPSPTRSEALVKFPTSAIAVLESSLPWADALEGVGTFEVTAFAIPRG